MHHGQIFRFCRKVPFVSQHPFLPLQLLYQLLYPKYQIEPTPHKLLWLTWSLLNTCIFMLTVLYFYRYSCYTNFCAQGPGRVCPSQATVADMVVAKYMYIYVNSPIFLPLQLLYQLLYPKYQIEPAPHKLLWLTWSLLNTCTFMITVLYFYPYSCYTNFYTPSTR